MIDITKNKHFPKTRAKTAYGLLGEIARIILAEPKRYNQGNWLRIKGVNAMSYEDMPACGTVGCVAGWVTALKAPTTNPQGFVTDHERGDRVDVVAFTARKVLGLTRVQEDELFDGSPSTFTKRNAEGDLVHRFKPGTLAYARLGAAHIRRFMKANAAQLKATKV